MRECHIGLYLVVYIETTLIIKQENILQILCDKVEIVFDDIVACLPRFY